MDQSIKKYITHALLAAFAWGMVALAACHTAPKRMPDLSIRRVRVGDVQLAVKEDQSWLKEQQNDLVGFRIRIDYLSGKTFSMQQNSLIDFGIQEDFLLTEGKDTVKPVFFQRIANGTANQAEYVAAFQAGKAPSGTATHCSLLFRDPLFGLGNQAIHF